MTPTHRATPLTEGNHDDALTVARIFLMARRARPNNRRNSCWWRLGDTMTTDAQEPGTAVRARARRMDPGKVRLSQRDIDMFLLCAEHSAAPYDLLTDAMG